MEKYLSLEQGMETISEEHINADNLISKITKEISNRWKCGLLLSIPKNQFFKNDTEKMALERLKTIENKMKSDDNFENQYKVEIDEYVKKQYCRMLT